ncbi:MAG: hypothetical protein A2511_04765 [Deltaproteobacteria bacterium RIFOXYD12_FULL_50_9]|nr:MAG: hypothetical protein A2511_04765 [Deltaproteobacteria bacterium RIFOXYD12_FULL_50_9]
MAPKNIFIRLKDLAERWDHTVDDLLQWGIAGDISIFVFLENVLGLPGKAELFSDIRAARRFLHIYGKINKDDLEILFHCNYSANKSELI